MPCDQWTEKISAYIDSEISASEMDLLDRHIQSCSRCAAEAFAQLKIRQVVSNAGKRYSPSREFKQKVLRETFAKARPRVYWKWLPTLATAAVLIAVLIGMEYRQASLESNQRLAEIADLHITTLASSTPVDIVSTDRHTVKPWFQGRIPFTFNLPELANTQFVLLGGRVTYLNQQPGAHLLYEIRKHRISVYIFQDHPESNRGFSQDKVLRERSFQFESWSQGGLRYYVIGDVNASDLDSLCQLLRVAAQ